MDLTPGQSLALALLDFGPFVPVSTRRFRAQSRTPDLCLTVASSPAPWLPTGAQLVARRTVRGWRLWLTPTPCDPPPPSVSRSALARWAHAGALILTRADGQR